MAKELGYLQKYELNTQSKTKKLDRLYINKDKFYQPDENPTQKIVFMKNNEQELA